MLDFTSVTREIRSVVSRRRELLTFLGTVFAAMGIFLQNTLQGGLPPSLDPLKGHVFAIYAFLLMVPSLIIALRLARLNGGMTLNGILYQRLMQDQDFRPRPPSAAMERASRVNVFGVSFLMFLLADIIAAFSAALLSLALGLHPWVAPVAGAVVLVAWLAIYLWFHVRAARFAFRKAFDEGCVAFTKNEWEEHTSGSLEDANHDMITILGLVGLIVFSAFEGLSGLAQTKLTDPDQMKVGDLTAGEVQTYGPIVYGLLMACTCFFGMVTYLRLRHAIGQRSLEIDPTDRPFALFKLTDSLLGYMLLAFFFAVSLHFALVALFFHDEQSWGPLIMIDIVAFLLAIVAEQTMLYYAGRKK